MSNNPTDEQITKPHEEVEISEELSPIILPTKLYEFFMANGKEGLDAMHVWLHLVYTARRQKTNQVWANNTYIRQGLHLGERKVKQVKAWLRKHNLIVYVQRKDPETGLMGKTYIRVHACAQQDTTAGAETARADTRTTGYNTQMLETPNEVLKDNNKGVAVQEASHEEKEKEPVGKDDINTAMEFLDTIGIGDNKTTRDNTNQAIENGIKPDEMGDFFHYLLFLAREKKNVKDVNGWAIDGLRWAEHADKFRAARIALERQEQAEKAAKERRRQREEDMRRQEEEAKRHKEENHFCVMCHKPFNKEHDTCPTCNTPATVKKDDYKYISEHLDSVKHIIPSIWYKKHKENCKAAGYSLILSYPDNSTKEQEQPQEEAMELF